jgi:hypothetical protein
LARTVLPCSDSLALIGLIPRESFATSGICPFVDFVARFWTRPLQVNAIAKSRQRSSPGGFKCPRPSRSDGGFLRHWEFGYAATTLIRPAFRERGFRRITISTS